MAKKVFKAYQMRIYRNGKLVEWGGPFKAKKAAVQDAKQYAEVLRKKDPNASFRATAAIASYPASYARPTR